MAADPRHDRFPARPPDPTRVDVLGGPVPEPTQPHTHNRVRWSTTSPEGLAERAVGVAGGCHYVRLAAPGAEPIYLGPYPNPAVARERAEAVRAFVTAVLRASGRR